MDREEQLKAVVRELAARAPFLGTKWRHVKSGKVVKVLFGCVREVDIAPMVSYSEDKPDPEIGTVVWLRPLEEFLDGRFVQLTHHPVEFSAADRRTDRGQKET